MGSTLARDAEKVRRAQLQAEATERACELLAAGVTPPEGLQARVRFIETYGARVYVAIMQASE